MNEVANTVDLFEMIFPYHLSLMVKMSYKYYPMMKTDNLCDVDNTVHRVDVQSIDVEDVAVVVVVALPIEVVLVVLLL